MVEGQRGRAYPTVRLVRFTGVWKAARHEGRADKSRDALALARRAKTRQRPTRTAGEKGPRASDEAIVSDDLAGQHNPPASQGPLGRTRRTAGGRYRTQRRYCVSQLAGQLGRV